MAKTFDVGSSTLVTFPVTSGNVDLAAYNAFVKETLKPTSDTLVAFRSRAVKPSCERCVQSNEKCVQLEDGRGVRCAHCSRRRLVCSWRADILIPATALYYGISAEEATILYEKWSDNYPPRTRPPHGNVRSDKTSAGSTQESTISPSEAAHPSSSSLRLRPRSAAPITSDGHLTLTSPISAPPSLARKAGKLRSVVVHQGSTQEPASKQDLGLRWPNGESIEFKSTNTDEETLRPRRTKKFTLKGREYMLKTEKISQTKKFKRKELGTINNDRAATLTDVDRPLEGLGGRLDHAAGTVKITIPASGSSRLNKADNPLHAPLSRPSTHGVSPATIPMNFYKLGNDSNLPRDLNERYQVLETRYLTLCDLYVQSTIESKAKDDAIQRLEGANQSLQRQLEEYMKGVRGRG